MRKKKQVVSKAKKRKDKNVQDEKLCMTKGQLCNVITAAEGKKNACPKARKFIKELKKEVQKS